MGREAARQPQGDAVGFGTANAGDVSAAGSEFYECLDLLLPHKRALFEHLVGRWKDLFNAKFDVLLYDLTSTYCESDPPFAEGDKGWFGYFQHSLKNIFPRQDQWIRQRLRSVLRKRHKLQGRARGRDHQRWPNAYFANLGLISLALAREQASHARFRAH